MDPQLADARGLTPLMKAAAAGHRDCVRFLEARASDLLARDAEGKDSLAHAVENRHAQIVEFLLSRAGSRGVASPVTRESLLTATGNADETIVAFLLETGTAQGLDEALSTAITNDQRTIAKRLLERGANPEVMLDKIPAVIQLSEKDDRALLGMLLEFGASPNVAGEAGETALLRAIQRADHALASFLLEAGADPNQADENSRSPLLAATESGEVSLVDLLLEKGADPGVRFPDGTSLLGRTLEDGNWEIAGALIKAGADPDAPCEGELSPMEVAFRDKNVELARFLLQGGTVAHPSLLFHSAESGSRELFDLFLDHGAPVNARDASGDTLLAKACREGDLDMAARLIFRGASSRMLGAEGQEPLNLAIATRHPEIVELLVSAGVDPNRPLREPISQAFLDLAGNKSLAFYAKRDSRFAPLMVAAAIGESDCIRALLKNGANRYPTTKGYQRYPISFAAEASNIEAQQLLVGYDPREAEQNVSIIVDLAEQKATLFKDGSVSLTSRVSTGTARNPTPTGDFVITHKHRTWTSTLYHSEMPYFMRLSCAAFGLHVGYVPNYPASHGCIRMPQEGAVAFWNAAPVGTPVSIVDSSKSATASNP